MVKLCDLHRLNVEKLRQSVKSLFLVAAGEKPGLAPGKCPHPSSCCLGDHHGGGRDVAASPPSPILLELVARVSTV